MSPRLFSTIVTAPEMGDLQPVKNDTRYVALDGLRGVAALLVVLFHVRWSNHLTHSTLVSNGFIAVDLFFILSGFVISANYSSRISSLQDAWRFMCLRFFRIYPIHLLVISAFVCVEFAKLISRHLFNISYGPQPPFTGSNSYVALVSNLLLIQGLPTFDNPSWNIPSWSISCEFAAYLVFAAAVLFGLCRRRMLLLGTTLVAVSEAMLLLYFHETHSILSPTAPYSDASRDFCLVC